MQAIIKPGFFGPVKLDELTRTDMYRDYLTQQQKKGTGYFLPSLTFAAPPKPAPAGSKRR